MDSDTRDDADAVSEPTLFLFTMRSGLIDVLYLVRKQ